MGVKERRAREKEQLQQQILGAARELLSMKGMRTSPCERSPIRLNTHPQQSIFISKTRQIFRLRLPRNTPDPIEYA